MDESETRNISISITGYRDYTGQNETFEKLENSVVNQIWINFQKK